MGGKPNLSDTLNFLRTPQTGFVILNAPHLQPGVRKNSIVDMPDLRRNNSWNVTHFKAPRNNFSKNLEDKARLNFEFQYCKQCSHLVAKPIRLHDES